LDPVGALYGKRDLVRIQVDVKTSREEWTEENSHSVASGKELRLLQTEDELGRDEMREMRELFLKETVRKPTT